MTRRLRDIAGALLALLVPLMILGACRTVTPNRVPLGERFPEVQGTSLSGETTDLPQALQGEVSVLLIGYTRRSQFDIDRWILGLSQLQTPVRLVEVPTAGGLFTRLFGERLDESMRRGIPEEDWPSVVTVYQQATRVTEFLGTAGRHNARVVLLDPNGVVCWVEARGYSAALVSALDSEVRALIDDAEAPAAH